MAKQAWDEVSTAQVIPGELAAQVYWHTIPYSQPVPCWTYVTQGLMAHRQKELVITLRRTDATGDDKAPDFVLKLLKHIFRLAKQGRTVDAGGYTSMTVAGAAAKEGLPFNLLYLDPIPLPGIPMPSPALTVRFMSVEEYRFFQAFGSMRLIAAWAQHYHYVPAPPWSEMPAPQVVSVERFQTSILNKTARAHLPQSTVSLEGKEIVFRLRPEARAALAGHLDRLPPLQPVAFLPNLDRLADSGLAWIPEQNQTAMNTTPTSRRARIAGCFMLFIPAQQAVSARVFEDGFALLAPTETWEDIRAAMVNGESMKVNTSGTSWRMEYVDAE
jgi:hypothetical protein